MVTIENSWHKTCDMCLRGSRSSGLNSVLSSPLMSRRYLLGESGRSHIVGFGKDPPTHVQNMPASCEAVPQPCNFVNAYLTPSANPNVLYGALVEVPDPTGRILEPRLALHCSHGGVTLLVGLLFMHGIT